MLALILVILLILVLAYPALVLLTLFAALAANLPVSKRLLVLAGLLFVCFLCVPNPYFTLIAVASCTLFVCTLLSR